jgi:zinc/manganese transport system substrate-binding protein
MKVVTTLPEFTWVVKELAPKVESLSLLEGTEDPHFVDATPSFIFKAAEADLVIFNGMELEVGWFPKVVEMSGNSKVQVGSKGYCNASSEVKKIEVLKNFDRSMGDVHPQGNPHYTISLVRMKEVAKAIANCLVKNGADQKAVTVNLKSLSDKLDGKFQELKKKLKSKTFYVYHREFNYLGQDFGFVFKQSLEKVPGVLPSANYLVKMAQKAKEDKPVRVLAASTAPKRILQKYQEMSGITYQMLNLHPRRGEDYIQFIEKLMLEIGK